MGLEWQAPRRLDINPPSGWLHLESRPSQAPDFRGSYDLWAPAPEQALEITAQYRWASERQLTYANSTGAGGDVQARLRLEGQWAGGFMYRWEGLFAHAPELGAGLEIRRESLAMVDGGSASKSTLDRLWLRGVARTFFGAGETWFASLELAIPLRGEPTPSGQAYLADLDYLGQPGSDGTAARAHAPTYGVTVAIGYRFGRRSAPEPARHISFVTPVDGLVLPERGPAGGSLPLQAPAALAPVPPPPPPVALDLPVPAVIVLDEAALRFALNSARILPQGQGLLHRWAMRLKALDHPPAVQVVGYADGTGGAPHNQRLSQARAGAVAQVLRDEGLTVTSVVGLGSTHPVASDATPEGRALNRRVEIRLQGVEARGVTGSEPIPESSLSNPSGSRP